TGIAGTLGVVAPASIGGVVPLADVGGGVDVNGAGCPGCGIKTNSTMYPRTPRPAVTKAVITNTTRTSVASTARYSAMPPQTPPMTRLVLLRSRRDFTDGLPSLRVLVCDGDRQSGDGGDWNGWLFGQGQKRACRDRDACECFERRAVEIRGHRGGDCGQRRRDETDEPRRGDTGEERRNDRCRGERRPVGANARRDGRDVDPRR